MAEGRCSRRGSELLDMIEAIINDELGRGIQGLGKRVTARIAVECGGQNVYFPSDKKRRDAKIYEEHTGDNIPDLARRYRLSVQTVYQIIREERARRRLRQVVLPGLTMGNTPSEMDDAIDLAVKNGWIVEEQDV